MQICDEVRFKPSAPSISKFLQIRFQYQKFLEPVNVLTGE